MSFSVKYVCVILSCAALAISIFADVIVAILYGPKFAASGILLQVLIWTQVLVATDTVLKQAMIANGKEKAVVIRALAGLAALAVLVIGLGTFSGSSAPRQACSHPPRSLSRWIRASSRAGDPLDATRFL